MVASKLESITHELKILWNYLTRQELSEYYGVTERTLYNYKKKLNLSNTPGQGVTVPNMKKTYSSKDKVEIWIHDGTNKYKKTTFQNWEHFSVWSKTHKNMVINTMNKDGHKYITCKFANQLVTK